MKIASCLAALGLFAMPAMAEIPNHTVKIGILNDQSGPFADQSGKGSVVAAQLAASMATTRTSRIWAARSCGSGSTRMAWRQWRTR